jgi:hypothetical protein
MDKKLLAGIAGLLDPTLIKLAREIAEKIPKESLLQSNPTEYILGALRGITEAYAEKFSSLSGVTIEKLSNLSGFISASLAQTKRTGNQDLLQGFLAQTLERLQKAENKKVEFEKIKEELALFKQITELAYPKTEPAESPVLQSLNKKLEEFRDKIKK